MWSGDHLLHLHAGCARAGPDQKLLKRLRGTADPGGLAAGGRILSALVIAYVTAVLVLAVGVAFFALSVSGPGFRSPRSCCCWAAPPGSLRHRPGRAPAEQQRRRRCGPGGADAAVVLLERHRLPGYRLDGHSRIAVPAQAHGRLRGAAWPGRPAVAGRLGGLAAWLIAASSRGAEALMGQRRRSMSETHPTGSVPGLVLLGGRRRAVSANVRAAGRLRARDTDNSPPHGHRSHSWPRIRGHECDSGP